METRWWHGLAMAIIAGLSAGQAWWLWRRWSRGDPPLPPALPSSLACALAASAALVSLVSRLAIDLNDAPPTPTVTGVRWALVINTGCWLMLVTLHQWDRPRPVVIPPASVIQSVQWGLQGFLAALLPTWLMLAVTFPLRQTAPEHALLQLWQSPADPVTIAAVGVLAVVIAPLLEELQFRVLLQDWLTQRFGPRVGWLIVVVWFALVHGYRDGLALLPLAAILGAMYQQQRSYLAVVITHALFNALNLLLAAWTAAYFVRGS
jgi:membrane protease YdiL (CAAX protease family)